AQGKPVRRGDAGERILLDSGAYTLRFGSGTTNQQIEIPARVTEGHTTVVPPTWAGLLVEVLTPDGAYLDEQYELISMDRWITYGKGRGFREQRLQDIRAWVLPPGMYRISKIGEGLNSLRNFITVQLNPGELRVVELIVDGANRDIISGGVKALNTRIRVGRNWTYGLRAGGNVYIKREVDDANVLRENVQFQGDLRTRANFDNARYWGTTELVLQDIVSKERNRRFTVTSDIAQLRTTWVRRLNDWLGPYVRGALETNLFPRRLDQDSVFILNPAGDTLRVDTTGNFEAESPFDPLEFAEGVGVNIDFLSRYYLEASAQVGLGAQQKMAFGSYGSYAGRTAREYQASKSIHEIGLETNLLAVYRLGEQATVDLRAEIFSPNGNLSRFRLDDITVDSRVYLSRFVEIGYVFQLQENRADVKNRYERAHSFSLRFSVNY
ncbi:MAG TPA: hypothetical protein VK465_13655, partial [Fibrobacteria bacterium]|nr:hypothetical protein [Fibrobacteria bacterium]